VYDVYIKYKLFSGDKTEKNIEFLLSCINKKHFNIYILEYLYMIKEILYIFGFTPWI